MSRGRNRAPAALSREMELQAVNNRHSVATALTQLVNREVSLSVSWTDGTSPLVCLTGRLEGVVEVPEGPDAPLSIVVAGQDVMLWPEDLAGVLTERSAQGLGIVLRLDSGVAISIDPTD